MAWLLSLLLSASKNCWRFSRKTAPTKEDRANRKHQGILADLPARESQLSEGVWQR